ncbi:MAG: C40 family peptidase [Clostridia bacterium]|nr:C40 family peptidase [Clostridia bacterium]
MIIKKIVAVSLAAAFISVGAVGIALSPNKVLPDNEINLPEVSLPEPPAVQPEIPEQEIPNLPEQPEQPEQQPGLPEQEPPKPEIEVKTVKYIKVTGDGVNLRTGAGTSYSVKGVAEKNTLYAYLGTAGDWYKLGYKNSTVYVSKKFCTVVEMQKSDNKEVEEVIEDGTKFMGVKYVYGAVRYHNGSGVKLKGFTTSAFDCSSLMQYIFYTGAGELLQVNTRTQVYQGKTVKKSQLKRGDLMFFTNATRINKKGVERIGHVALYLGDNYILHTASDYAKIEQISSTRWSYYIQTQRIL